MTMATHLASNLKRPAWPQVGTSHRASLHAGPQEATSVGVSRLPRSRTEAEVGSRTAGVTWQRAGPGAAQCPHTEQGSARP
jgi:hypothetical protein